MLIAPDNPEFARRANPIRLLGIDFDGVMTDHTVYVFDNAHEAVRCSRLEGLGLPRMAATGVHCFILSTEANPVVTARARKLGNDCRQDIADKVVAFERIRRERGPSMEEAAFIGNDVNHLELLKRMGLPCVVADAYEDLEALNCFRTTREGGDWAVRELCDAIATVRERINADQGMPVVFDDPSSQLLYMPQSSEG
jgi:3-deoxy-D-manno-octulosonate 8-phosphate phosphatase (KDO 8-P phosphatase)